MKDPPAERRAAGRPRDLAKAEAILDAAWQLFLKHGVETVAIEKIAAEARVSKATLYVYYDDKTALFEAAMRREMVRIEQAQGLYSELVSDLPLSETLRQFGIGIMTFLASPPAVAFYNALSSELRRHPDLSKAFWNLGPGRTRSNLAQILAGAAKKGEIKIDDPLLAAELLFGAWQGFSNLQFALDVKAEDARKAITARVDSGIEMFMGAFSTK